MSEEEVDTALCLHSPLLIAEVHETARRTVENYGQKLARLDAKTTALLGAIGLSLTVAFTYGGQMLLGHAKDMSPHRYTLALAAFWIALFAGIFAGIFASVALFISEHAELADRAIFDGKELRAADALDPEEQQRGLANYRRAMTLHMWLVAKQREKKVRRKAKHIERGQGFFLGFLAILLLVCIKITTRLV